MASVCEMDGSGVCVCGGGGGGAWGGGAAIHDNMGTESWGRGKEEGAGAGSRVHLSPMTLCRTMTAPPSPPSLHSNGRSENGTAPDDFISIASRMPELLLTEARLQLISTTTTVPKTIDPLILHPCEDNNSSASSPSEGAAQDDSVL